MSQQDKLRAYFLLAAFGQEGVLMTKKRGVLLGLSWKNILFIMVGSFMMAFSMVNIHGPSKITEGGILGLSLLLKNQFTMDQSFTAPILDGLAYILAFSMLGKYFLKTSLVASFSYTAALFVIEGIGPVIPSLYGSPFLAAILGGLFIGVGASFVIMQGGASGGDDALAMALSKKTGIRLALVFLLLDLFVLGCSLTYIPFRRLFWSIVTTFVSSMVIGQFEALLPKKKTKKEAPKHSKTSPEPSSI